MTIVEFLHARITEDEDMARVDAADAMSGHRWKHYPEHAYNELQAHVLETTKRTIAECQAKRAIIERETAWNTFDPPAGLSVRWNMDGVTMVEGREVGPAEGRRLMEEWTHPKVDTPTLRILAAVYADHPDYDTTWRVA